MRSLGGTVTALTEGSIGVSTVERKRLHHPFMQNLDNLSFVLFVFHGLDSKQFQGQFFLLAFSWVGTTAGHLGQCMVQVAGLSATRHPSMVHLCTIQGLLLLLKEKPCLKPC